MGFRLGLGNAQKSTNGSHCSSKCHIVGYRTLILIKSSGVCRNYNHIFQILNKLIFKSLRIKQLKLQIIMLIYHYLLRTIITILCIFNYYLTLKLLLQIIRSEILFYFIEESTNNCWKMFSTLLQVNIYLNMSNFWTAITMSFAFEMETVYLNDKRQFTHSSTRSDVAKK